VAGEEVLGEGLAALQPRGGGGGAEHAQAGGAEQVDDAGHQRRLGADDGQVDVLVAGQFAQAFQVVGLDRHVAALGLERGAGVARRDQHFVHARRLGELPGQRVLAAAGTDDEEFHRLRFYGTGRAAANRC
jgi:hypothetical protein